MSTFRAQVTAIINNNDLNLRSVPGSFRLSLITYHLPLSLSQVPAFTIFTPKKLRPAFRASNFALGADHAQISLSAPELQIKLQIMTDNHDDVCRASPCQPKAYKKIQKIRLLKVTDNVSGSSLVPLVSPVAPCAPHLRENKSVDLGTKREKVLDMKLTVKRSSRRLFLSQNSAALATISILPGHVLGLNGATPPSEKLNIAGIGVGGQGARRPQ